MKQFVITADSAADMPREYLQEKDIPVMSLSYMIDGETYEDMDGLESKEFFDRIRNGSMPTTSQVNPEQARAVFEPLVKAGKEILHIGFSSGLSGSVNSAKIAAEELMEEYKDARIIVIDTKCASMGEGLLLYKAVQMKEQGKNIDEIADWVEKNKLHVCHNVTVDDLFHLQRGGRISKATAVLGSMIKIKPIIFMDNDGKLQVVGKERGRKKSLNVLVEQMEKQFGAFENDIVMIVHGDCMEDAEYVKGLIEERFGIRNVMINDVGSVIGSHTGPGVVAVFSMGNKLQ